MITHFDNSDNDFCDNVIIPCDNVITYHVIIWGDNDNVITLGDSVNTSCDK